MGKLAFAANCFQLRLAGILMDTWIFFLFVAIADEFGVFIFFTSKYRSFVIDIMDKSIHSIAQMSEIYCAEQIKIPPTFPHILKLYAKAAIRTQPYDLLQWTCAYFRALANDDVPPVKERLEYPPFCHPSGITPGYLKTLLNVFGHVEKICVKSLLERWQGIVLLETTLFHILLVGKFLPEKECHFYKFLAIACGFLGKNLFETMIYVCELLTDEPEGGSAMIPLSIFLQLYEYLGNLDCSGKCRCVIDEDSEGSLHPTLPPVSEEPSTLSRSYSIPSASVKEEEETVTLDVCDYTPSESRSSGALLALMDYGSDTKHFEVEEMHHVHLASPKGDQNGNGLPSLDEDHREHETGALTKKNSRDDQIGHHRTSETAIASDFPSLDMDDNTYYRYNDLYSYYGGEESEMEMLPYEQIDDYEPIGLETILRGICECLEPVRESDRVPTPPPPDPFEEFLKRMKQEVEEGRLPTRFEVPGIGPQVSINRVTAVGLWLADCARRQEGMVGPRNIRHFLCPDLEDNKN